uniref:Uncharacterized protein n=1 Tax=Globodera rostochiensis TaxID=31243 RepID=A0A914HTU1_GLORO
MYLLALCLLFVLLLEESAVLGGSPTDKKHWSDCKFKNGLLQLVNGNRHFICYESKLGTKFGTSSKVGRRFNVKKGNGKIADECPRGADGFQSWHAIRITEQSDGKMNMELNGDDFGIVTNEPKHLNLTNALANFRQFGGEFQSALTLGAFMDNYQIASGLIAMEIILSANKNGTKRCKTQMPPPPPVFKGLDLIKSSNQRPKCARVFLNDSDYIAQIGKRRLTFEDPLWLEMGCANGIRKRNYFPVKEGFEDAEFPLAQDYVFLEKELASSYSPNNWYCYSVDHKSNKKFHMRLKQLSECLPNVVVSTRKWNIDSAGHNMTRALLDCLHLLTVPEKRWEYVALLQNHDVAIKTNREMVQIYRWLNGANDVEVTWLPRGRVNESLDWSFDAIGLFRNASRNLLDVEGFPPKLVFSKGYMESSLSRKMAEFIVYELDLTETVRRLESGDFGIDEILVPTLHAADALRAPGGFTRDCLERKGGPFRVQHITRQWRFRGDWMEDLADKMAVWPHLFANKLMPQFDFGALLCWWEKMHQRAYIETRQRSLSRLNSAFYADLPHVRFQKFAADLRKLNDAQRGTKDAIPFRKALAFFNCSTDEFNVN